MAPASSAYIFCFALLLIAASASAGGGFRHESKFARPVKRWKRKTTTSATANTTSAHVRMYLHETLTGPNATAVRVVSGPGAVAAAAAAAVVNFGDVLVMDAPLTEGPGADTRLVARVQGLCVVSSREGLVLQISASVAFVAGAGEYAGSTLVVAGSDPLRTTAPAREYAVVGGTGRFRGASGYVLEKTFSMDPVTGNGVFELDVYVDT